MLSNKQLAEIQERCEKTTPGPWKHDRDGNASDVYAGTLLVCEMPTTDWYREGAQKRREGRATDADFIAASRADIPALLTTIEELRGMLEDARIVLYGTDEVGQYNMAQQIQEVLR